MDHPFSKPSPKNTILPVAFYILAAVLLITAFVALVACHQNVSAQLKQGVPVKGNELAIVNLYLTSCVQYFAFAAAMVFCGKAANKLTALKSEEPVEIDESTLTEDMELNGDETDFEDGGFREQEQ